MCLAVPAKIVAMDKDVAEAAISGVKRKVDLRLVEGVKAGDWVLVHAGFAIEKIDAKEARKTLSLLKKIR